MFQKLFITGCLLAGLVLSGCSAVKPFPNTARAGDSIALVTGWKQGFSRGNITVTITPSIGSPVTYLPGSPAVRAAVNFYPDPLSGIVLSQKIGDDLTPYAQVYSDQINLMFTAGDKDWWQTVLFIDLPSSLASGAASIDIVSAATGETYSTTVDIIDGDGQADGFDAEFNGPLNDYQLASLERVGHYVLSFSASTVPYAIQLELSHDPDAANGGSGHAYVVTSSANLVSALWRDNGTNLSIVLTPTQMGASLNIQDFKFYIAGGITGLQLDTVQAVDIDGAPVSGVTGTLEQAGF